MKVIGFNLDKLHAEKISEKDKEVTVKTNIELLEIMPAESNFLKIEEDLLGVKFSYIIDYEPNYAKIEINGRILVAVDHKQAKDILKQWQDKKTPDEFKIFIFNIILKKSSLKALELEEELNLPFHLPLPSIKKQEKQS